MKTLAMTCLFFGAVLVLGGRCGADQPAATDPLSNGKPLSEWIKALKASDYNTRVQAADAIGRLGPQAKTAVPALREALLDKTGPVPNAAGAALWKVDRVSFTSIFKDAKQGRARHVAVLSLPTIGSDARELAPLVLKMATDQGDPDHEHALLALGYIGANPADVLPVLTAALQDQRGQYARMLSAQALGHLGKQAKDALPALHTALADPDAQVRVDAANAVWKIEQKPDKVLPVLTAALKEGSQSPARGRAVHGLGKIGPGAKAAFPVLLEVWKAEPSGYFKGQMAKALKAIDPKAAGDAGVK